MGSSRFLLKAADEESKNIPHEFPRSHWLKATGQRVLERYLSATMMNCVQWDRNTKADMIGSYAWLPIKLISPSVQHSVGPLSHARGAT